MKFSRRAFLKSASASVSIGLLDRIPSASSEDLEKEFAEVRANLLEMVNEERAVEKVPLLAMDDLATQVATKHAIDMANGEFASHWGRDGLKPYHRYSFAGGIHATQENVSAADDTWSIKFKNLKQYTSYLHVRLYQETPPNDGHRRAILAPQHTHVGFGLAVERFRLRMVQLYVSKHVEVGSVVRTAKHGAKISFAGRVLNRDHVLRAVEVFFEPTPKTPELSWLQEVRSYSLPTESEVLRPKLPPPLMYADRTFGVVEITPSGSFRTPIKLFKKEPGIYTIVAWVKPSKAAKAFPATEVCIRAE